MIWIYALVSVLLVSLVSLVGIAAILITRKTSNIVLYLVSFAAGGLLGGALLHLIPEASEHAGGFTMIVSLSILAGVVFSFLFENLLWNHFHTPAHEHNHKHARPVAYLNLLGDGIHNFVDGLIIGGAYIVNIPLGITTTLAVIMHEIPQEIGDFGILLHAGFSVRKALLFNFISALMAVAGTLIALMLSVKTDVAAYLVPFAAGNFIYISLTDLVPELHHLKNTKYWGTYVGLFLLGILIMLVL